MLGRTAASLFWMSRYMERAENLARLIEVGYRASLTPGNAGRRNEWRSTLAMSACLDGFTARHGDAEEIDDAAAIAYLLFDGDNPSSLRACLERARNNGRGVRTSLTRDMWEALNSMWLEFSALRPEELRAGRLLDVLDLVRQRTMLFRGAVLGTSLRSSGYYFAQLGAFIERADQTARILDVKYYLLLPRSAPIGGEADTQQWEMVLRAVSAHRAYRHVYRDQFRPRNVAEFLILRRELPRSLRFASHWIADALDGLAAHYGQTPPCHALGHRIDDQLVHGDLDTIYSEGLHDFLLEFIASNHTLAVAIANDYHFA